MHISWPVGLLPLGVDLKPQTATAPDKPAEVKQQRESVCTEL